MALCLRGKCGEWKVMGCKGCKPKANWVQMQPFAVNINRNENKGGKIHKPVSMFMMDECFSRSTLQVWLDLHVWAWFLFLLWGKNIKPFAYSWLPRWAFNVFIYLQLWSAHQGTVALFRLSHPYYGWIFWSGTFWLNKLLLLAYRWCISFVHQHWF